MVIFPGSLGAQMATLPLFDDDDDDDEFDDNDDNDVLITELAKLEAMAEGLYRLMGSSKD